MADDYGWFQCKLITNKEHGKSLTINMDAPVSIEHKDKISKATGLLMENIEESPYKHFQDRYNLFKEGIANVAVNLKVGQSSSDDLRALSGKLDDLLSAFRAFDDRTSHNLSQRYGKESEQLTTFKTALSYEFDNVFEYRFLCQLRNYSQHAGNPITNLKANAYLENEKVISVCDPTFDSKILLEKYSKWNSIVRKDLEKIQGEFPVELTVDVVRKSCSRAYSKLLLAQKDDLEKAIKEIMDTVKDPKDGEYPILVRMKREPKSADDLKNITIENIRIDLAKIANDLLKQVEHRRS